jgi:Phage tail assembly chaperone, TAC
MSIRDTILKAKPLPVESLVVPEWEDVRVYFRPLSCAQQQRFDDLNKANTPWSILRATLLTYSLCDEAGEALFEEKDVEELNKLSGLVQQRLVDVVNRVNGFGKQVAEEMAKN